MKSFHFIIVLAFLFLISACSQVSTKETDAKSFKPGGEWATVPADDQTDEKQIRGFEEALTLGARNALNRAERAK